jgi:putative DNA methylase
VSGAVSRKKLIEVALPLKAINEASAREKSIRHGHPSTLHLWWARRPLAAARAVIFAQMVDDPSSLPDLFPTAKKQEKERQRLFRIIEELVKWENTTNETVLQAARNEIWESWRRACADNADHPRAKELFDRHKLPAFHDPFAGGGSLPLEAQRLGLEAYASDLNPVAVLINKAMIEIPPKFAGRPPVNPESRRTDLIARQWKGAQGLAEDVRYYGKWMRDEAEKRIGHLYPKIEVTPEMAKGRPDLKPYVGKKLTVIAWLWARTVKSPNPAFAKVDVPLASTFMLSTKEGKEAYVEPVLEEGGYRFTVKVGKPKNAEAAKNGTKLAGANFVCLMSGSPISGDYIKAEGQAGRMGARMMAIVSEGDGGRIFLAPTAEHEATARKASPDWMPEGSLPPRLTGGSCVPYGMTTWASLFTERQLVALTTLSSLVLECRAHAGHHAADVGTLEDSNALRDEGVGAKAYADAVSLYLAFCLDKATLTNTTQATWQKDPPRLTQAFGRQSLPMTWDYAEANPLSEAGGGFGITSDSVGKVLERLPLGSRSGRAAQEDAAVGRGSRNRVVSTDPPYYDNIGYADLSDYFYVWIRPCTRQIYPALLGTLAVPKSQELVATTYRHGSREKAESFFLAGMTHAMRQLSEGSHPGFPVTIYYAFRQAENETDGGAFSTGWDTFLAAVIEAGLTVDGTWPMRTELTGNLKKGISALASSIILVCRPRPGNAPTATRREFVTALKSELPSALTHLQRGNIAPVDLAQAAIGPGMAVYTRYSKVLDAEGKPLSVREALALINQTLDEALAEQEGDFDSDTRWALTWFEQSGFAEGEYGVAEQLSKSKNTSVAGMVDAGILKSSRGKVRLLKPAELPASWDPAADPRLTAWEMVHHLIRVLEAGGESAAAQLAAKLKSKAEIARELAYRLYTVCERKKRAPEALSYNALVQSWPEILRLAQEGGAREAAQGGLFSAVEG